MNDQWRDIFLFAQECYADVDYDKNGEPVLPPLTLIFTPDEITHQSNPVSPWDSGDGGNEGNMNPDFEPEGTGRGKIKV